MREFFTVLFDSESQKSLLFVCFISAVSGIFSASLIALVGQTLVDIESFDSKKIYIYVSLLIVLVVVSLSLDLLAKWYLSKYSAARHRQLHLAYSKTVLNDALRQTETTGMARLITIYTEDMSIIGSGLNVFANVSVSFFVVLGCLGYLIYISPSLLLLTLVVGFFAVIGYHLIHKKSIALAGDAFFYRDKHVSQFKDLVHGIAELKLNYKKRYDYFYDLYMPTVLLHEKHYLRFVLTTLLANAWVQLVVFILLIAIVLSIVLTDLSVEVIGPFVLVVLFMRSHVLGLVGAVPTWSRAGVALRRIQDQGYGNLKNDQTLEPTKASELFYADSNAHELSLKITGLTWDYTSEENNSSFTVGPISVNFSSGELIFLVGHNGAGKSTFAKLVSGLYESEQGAIVCNGVEINDSNRASYSELFSVIFNDPFIFNQLTISDSNDRLGSNSFVNDPMLENFSELDEPGKRIQHYLEKLQLHHKVVVENNQLSTTQLSGGQRKRLALLAAYLEDKPVMIFDEWAENQDPAFKDVFYHELLPELRSLGKLVIVISHESQYFHVADKQVTLDSKQTGVTQLLSVQKKNT